MSTIALSIGGRAYAIACDAGEEAHIAELGAMIDAKLATLPAMQSEARGLLFAALLLAEDLHEARGDAPAPAPPAAPSAVADQLVSIAARLENLASHFDTTLLSGAPQAPR